VFNFYQINKDDKIKIHDRLIIITILSEATYGKTNNYVTLFHLLRLMLWHRKYQMEEIFENVWFLLIPNLKALTPGCNIRLRLGD
jgi:hypothetical protein